MQGPPGLDRRPAAPASCPGAQRSGYAPLPGLSPLPLAPKQKSWVMPSSLCSVVVITLIIVVVILMTSK